MPERLQKILSAAGIASRRKAEQLITDGRVLVDGKPASLGDRADLAVNVVTVDGKPVSIETKRYIAVHKPRGYVTTASDPHGRRKVTDLVDIPERVYPVGRLDYDTEGLLLLTNDGGFAEHVSHPRYEIPKTYVATLARPCSPDDLQALQDGLELDDGLFATTFARTISHDRRTVELTIHEGRNRIVRRAFEALGFTVQRLVRTQIGRVELAGLPPGKWRELTAGEVASLGGGPPATR